MAALLHMPCRCRVAWRYPLKHPWPTQALLPASAPAGGFAAPYLTHVGISLMFALVAGGLIRWGTAGSGPDGSGACATRAPAGVVSLGRKGQQQPSDVFREPLARQGDMILATACCAVCCWQVLCLA